MGKIDNKLVYRKRKIGSDVKKYTKTVNPDTPGQQTQKGFFKNAIDAWSIDGYSAADKFAWDQFAKTKKVITSGFNRFTGLKIDAEKEGFTWSKLTNCIIYDVTSTGFKVDINVSSDLSGILYLGTSKYSMLEEFIGIFSVDKYTFNVTGLLNLKKYYFFIKNTSVGEEGRTGIYSKKTLLYTPIPIDIGDLAIERTAYMAGFTIVNKGNPANESGVITSIELWASTELTNCQVATFYVVSGNNLSTRDTELIGTIPGGSKQTKSVNLDVEKDDYIGVYSETGLGPWISESGGSGMWYKNGHYMPCSNEAFSSIAHYAISLYGIGEA